MIHALTGAIGFTGAACLLYAIAAAVCVWLCRRNAATLLLAVMLLSGCQTIQPRTYRVICPFTITTGDADYIQAEWVRYGGRSNVTVDGFSRPFYREIYVTCDNNGIPKLDVLGHEVWHLLELGGAWHE
jgi:uncharacterized membrane protein YeiB